MGSEMCIRDSFLLRAYPGIFFLRIASSVHPSSDLLLVSKHLEVRALRSSLNDDRTRSLYSASCQNSFLWFNLLVGRIALSTRVWCAMSYPAYVSIYLVYLPCFIRDYLLVLLGLIVCDHKKICISPGDESKRTLGVQLMTPLGRKNGLM